jgi:hypothetical protein
MTETPIQRLRDLLEHTRSVADDLRRVSNDHTLTVALEDLALLEPDAAIGAAVRECEGQGLRCSYHPDKGLDAAHIWRAAGDCSPHGHGPDLPAALADWQRQNPEVEG